MRGLPRRTVWAGLVLACFVSAGRARAGDANVPVVSEQVLSELRGAGEARKALLAEHQDWALDREKLELLKATILGEAQRHGKQAQQARQAEKALRDRLQRQQERHGRLLAVEAAVDSLCERLEKALADLAGRSLPGVVPPDRSESVTEPARRLAAAVERLDDAARRAKRSAVEVVGGSLAGRPTAVRLLRIGGVAAWWMSLDGHSVGTAAVRDGRCVLTPTTEAPDADAIRKAFGIAEGRATPDWVLLPVSPPPARKE